MSASDLHDRRLFVRGTTSRVSVLENDGYDGGGECIPRGERCRWSDVTFGDFDEITFELAVTHSGRIATNRLKASRQRLGAC
jgi:hypothetical protein